MCFSVADFTKYFPQFTKADSLEQKWPNFAFQITLKFHINFSVWTETSLGPNLFSIAKGVYDWNPTLYYYMNFESEHSHPYFISNNFSIDFVLKFIQVTFWYFSSLCFLKSFPFLVFADIRTQYCYMTSLLNSVFFL